MAGNPWLERRVLHFAHQGGAREAPSSTLFAMRQAVKAGADALELDVHATADGRLVVCHDATVDRTTGGKGAIADLVLAELRRLDNAYWWVPGQVVARDRPEADYVYRGRAPEDPSFGIASLDEVLEEFAGVFLNLDIKQTAPAVAPYEAALAKALRAHGRSDDVIVASFLDAATDAFAALAPEINTSAGTMATAEFHRAVQEGAAPPPSATRHQALQVPAMFGDITVVDERFVEAAHAAGLAVHVWTIDDADEMDRLLDLGVDGIMSDRPTVVAAVLGRRGQAWSP
jgi:glycerophosphoryl diester phosphodiesterase